MFIIQSTKDQLSVGSVKKNQAILVSKTEAEKVFFPKLETSWNTKQEFDFNVNFFGKDVKEDNGNNGVRNKNVASDDGVVKFEKVAVKTLNLEGLKDQAEFGLFEVTEKDTDATVLDKVLKSDEFLVVIDL